MHMKTETNLSEKVSELSRQNIGILKTFLHVCWFFCLHLCLQNNNCVWHTHIRRNPQVIHMLSPYTIRERITLSLVTQQAVAVALPVQDSTVSTLWRQLHEVYLCISSMAAISYPSCVLVVLLHVVTLSVTTSTVEECPPWSTLENNTECVCSYAMPNVGKTFALSGHT